MDLLRQKIKAAKTENRLLYFLIIVRLFPFTPNFLLNLMAPWMHVPLSYFATSVFLGLAPYNFMTLSAGIMLSEIQNTGDIFTVKQVGGMVILSLLLAIPSSFRSKPQKEE